MTLPRAAAALLVLAAACGGVDRLAVDEVESSVAATLSRRWGVGPVVVACPAEVEARAGASFDCDVTVAGLPLAVRVEQRDADGTLDLTPSAAVLDVDVLARDVARVIADELDRDAEVTCDGGAVVVVEPGGTIACEAADGADRRTVTVTVTDVDGSRRYQVGPAG